MAFVSGIAVGARGTFVQGHAVVCKERANLRTQGRCVLNMSMDEAEDEAPSDTAVPTSADIDNSVGVSQSRSDLTTQLLEISAVTNRGQTASAEQKSLIEDIVASLEADNPNPAPVETDAIDGRWNLIYSSTPFYKVNPLLATTASPFLEVGQVRQTISMETSELINEIEITAFPMLTGAVVANGRITPVGAERLEFALEKVSIKGGSAFERFDLGALKLDIPVEEIYQRVRGTLPETFVDTYYVSNPVSNKANVI
uniref:Plastid lipid-associated protein/fibrillin conserved domain-containing protein n=1 Tax=Rhodosorus marinus TaxID=101924 RepID=A0A7S2ZQH8_9RHOD|mmetsp:Transcript_28220/g.110849  ORF Transcript_28220/g.110849 Transcript_28220/m.110849 type:complete len:256 (+) Transcript_28220:150-917(+)